MINNDLFELVLINPIKKGANKLYIVSGYASSAMAFHHMECIKKIKKQIQINLVIGMCSQDGLSVSNHRGFQKIMNDNPDIFKCYYFGNNKISPIHSKVYSWYRDNDPLSGFVGSANYTQTAFYEKQGECMETSNPKEGFNYYKSIREQSIKCDSPDAENTVQIFNDKYFMHTLRDDETSSVNPILPMINSLEHIKISFLDYYGKLPGRSGLNWGQRPEAHREPNQAYIKLPASVYKTDFFPPKKTHFTVLTDDGKTLICSRAQEVYGKAIHTPHNNSLIGEYFRYRLGLPNGAKVTLDDMNRYGRTDVEFYKIDNETYYMDFSVV